MNEETKYKRIAVAVIALVLVLTVFLGIQTSQIGFDYEFERFFPEDDPETEFFQEYRHKYASENDMVMFSLVNSKGVFEQDFLREAQRLQDSLSQLNYVIHVESILSLKEPIKDPLFGSFYERPYLRWDEPEHYATDSVRIFESPQLINSFVTEDAKAFAIILDHKEFLSKEKCDELEQDIERTLADFKFDEVYKTGRSVAQGYFINRLKYELILFMSASAILIIIFLIIAFRSAWGVYVPLLVVWTSIIWLLGVMHITGKEIDLLLTILPTIMFIVGMSDVVHIISKYFDELRKGVGKLSALKTSMKEVGMATFLTSVTTSIGFLTLMGSTIIPIREFGLYCAAGVILAYILAFTVLPSTLILSRTPKVQDQRSGSDFWSTRLHRLYSWIIRKRRSIAWASLALILISLFGASQVRVNNFLLEDLRKDNPVRMEFDYFEEAYSGFRPLEIAFSVTDSSKTVLDPDVLRSLDKLDSFLQKDYGAGFVISPLNMVKALNKASHNGKSEFYCLPETDKKTQALAKSIHRMRNTAELKKILDSKLKECRVMGKIGDWGKIEVDKRDILLAQFWEKEMPDYVDYHITGTSSLIDLNNEYLSTTLIRGLVLAFLIVGLIVGLMYRSLKMIIIALIPNMLPLVMVAAVMGFAGINLKVSTSIIFTIAFGIAVDDTIHFVSRLRLELAKGKSLQYALKRTFIGTGKAIIITSLILIAGFLSLIMSSFNGTFYTGVLLSMALLFAVIVDLLLLPVLFWMFYGEETDLAK